jgi:hypothetical protein
MRHISNSVAKIMGSEDHDQTLPSTFFEQPASPKRRPTVPAAIGRVIAELGLRYRPSAQADLEAHAEALRLLSEDVADVPPNYLEAAARKWVRESKFMPKASELIELARSFVVVRHTDTRTLAQKYNDRMAADPLARPDRKWIDLPDGGVKLVPK